MYMYIEWVIQHILIYMYTLVVEETEKCTYPSGYSTRKNGDLGWVYGIECSSSNQNICINPVVNQMRLYATPHSYGFVQNIVCRRYKKHKHDKDTQASVDIHLFTQVHIDLNDHFPSGHVLLVSGRTSQILADHHMPRRTATTSKNYLCFK